MDEFFCDFLIKVVLRTSFNQEVKLLTLHAS